MLVNLVRATAAALVLIALPANAHDTQGRGSAANPSTGYAFPLPEPGSYSLPPIKQAGGGDVLDENGRQHELAGLVRGQITVLSFVYMECTDICPLATAMLMELRHLAGEDSTIASRLRLISMSFDPEHDTPEGIAEAARLWRGDSSSVPAWLFLTAPDQTALAPILAAYNQAVMPSIDEADEPNGGISHVLRVFLIDDMGMVRNIYSLDFLDPELVLRDVRTLLAESLAAGG